MPSEMFRLKWKDFQSNCTYAFRDLREDKDFLDVTLSCGDKQIQAHKVIISACSPFFRDVLRKNPHTHPLLYLKGVKYTHLQSLLTYMYCGEVSLAQEDLTSFLAVAEDLKVKGLIMDKSVSDTPSRPHTTHSRPHNTSSRPHTTPSRPQTTPSRPHTTPQFSDPVSPPKKPTPSFTPKQDDEDIQEVPTVRTESLQCSGLTAGELYEGMQNQYQEGLHDHYQYQYQYQEHQECQDNLEYEEPLYEEPLYQEPPRDRDEETVEVPVEKLAVKPNNNYEEHDKAIDSLIERLGYGHLICKVCGKEEMRGRNDKRNMVSHIEFHHMEGISHPCNKCEKEFSTRNSLANHVSRIHKKK